MFGYSTLDFLKPETINNLIPSQVSNLQLYLRFVNFIIFLKSLQNQSLQKLRFATCKIQRILENTKHSKISQKTKGFWSSRDFVSEPRNFVSYSTPNTQCLVNRKQSKQIFNLYIESKDFDSFRMHKNL
jgi:hypothetical protein